VVDFSTENREIGGPLVAGIEDYVAMKDETPLGHDRCRCCGQLGMFRFVPLCELLIRGVLIELVDISIKIGITITTAPIARMPPKAPVTFTAATFCRARSEALARLA
jgi:hypothetical protein